MGGRAARSSGASHPTRFPVVIGMVCTTLAVALFFSGLLPALREQSDLDRIEDAQHELLGDLVEQTRQLRQLEHGLARDPQSILLEIDARGLTPEELLDQHPEESSPDPLR